MKDLFHANYFFLENQLAFPPKIICISPNVKWFEDYNIIVWFLKIISL